MAALDILRNFGKKYANDGTYARSFLVKIWELFGGLPNPDDELKGDLTTLSITTPNTASFKQFLHFSQAISGKRFAKYDYGAEKNMKVYESEKPPLYDLSRIKAPVALFYSKNDQFYGAEGMDQLADSFGNCVYKHQVQKDSFNHLDFLFHVDVIPLLYGHVLDLMEEFKPKV